MEAEDKPRESFQTVYGRVYREVAGHPHPSAQPPSHPALCWSQQTARFFSIGISAPRTAHTSQPGGGGGALLLCLGLSCSIGTELLLAFPAPAGWRSPYAVGLSGSRASTLSSVQVPVLATAAIHQNWNGTEISMALAQSFLAWILFYF